MESIKGELVKGLETNIAIAENQEEYHTLYACDLRNGTIAYGFELTDEEIEDIVKHRRIILNQTVGHSQMQPICLMTKEQCENELNACELCGDPIMGLHYVTIDGDKVCNQCMTSYKKSIEKDNGDES